MVDLINIAIYPKDKARLLELQSMTDNLKDSSMPKFVEALLNWIAEQQGITFKPYIKPINPQTQNESTNNQ